MIIKLYYENKAIGVLSRSCVNFLNDFQIYLMPHLHINDRKHLICHCSDKKRLIVWKIEINFVLGRVYQSNHTHPAKVKCHQYRQLEWNYAQQRQEW